MKFVTFLFCLLILCSSGFAYDEDAIDSIMTTKNIYCSDVTLNCFELIPKYFHQNKIDSFLIFLDYWENHCQSFEEIIRIKILFSIYEGSFTETMYGEDIILYILEYKDKSRWDWRYSNFEREFVDQYDNFTKELADEILQTESLTEIEKLLAWLYSSHDLSFFKEIKEDKYNNTDLKRYYNEFIADILNTSEMYYSFSTGYWAPLGNNKLIGNHPSIGIGMGFYWNSYLFDLTVMYKMGDSKEQYIVNYKDSLIETNDFHGLYYGAEFGKRFFRNMHHEFDLLAGIGGEGFTVTNDDGEEGETYNCLNINFGIGYKYYLRDYSNTNLNFQIRYNIVDYNTDGGTDLSGNTISLRVVFGFSKDNRKNEMLRKINYEY